MTTEQLAALSPEQKRVKIAEACGWKREVRKRYAGSSNVEGWGLNTHLPEGSFGREFTAVASAFPDFLNSLDSMHEAEKTLFKDRHVCGAPCLDLDWIVYLKCIMQGIEPNLGGYVHGGYPSWDIAATLAHATAAQRADAFLLAVG